MPLLVWNRLRFPEYAYSQSPDCLHRKDYLCIFHLLFPVPDPPHPEMPCPFFANISSFAAILSISSIFYLLKFFVLLLPFFSFNLPITCNSNSATTYYTYRISQKVFCVNSKERRSKKCTIIILLCQIKFLMKT